MNRLLAATALAITPLPAMATVYETACERGAVANPANPDSRYMILFDEHTFVVSTGKKLILYQLDGIEAKGTFIEAFGSTPIGTTWRIRVVNPNGPMAMGLADKEVMAYFNPRTGETSTDQCGLGE